MTNPIARPSSRRQFLKSAAAATSTVIAAPTILRAVELPAAGPGSIQGEGAYKYEWMHEWLKLPADVKLGNCHGVQQSADGRLFIHHQGTPSMLVCDMDGKVIKTWGPEYAGVAHGLQLRKEGSEEFLYLALNAPQRRVVKTTLDGEVIYEKKCPLESNLYKDKDGKPSDGKFNPTNIAFHPTNGDWYLADGYGSSYIHRYNLKGEYQSSFGGLGSEPGKMKCCHGIYTDMRFGEPKLAVADRENNRIQYFTMDGKHESFVQGKADDGIIRRPCHFHVRGTDMLIPDLRGRMTILDKDNKAVAELFDNQDPAKRANNRVPKDQWADGQFICPHGAIFDSEGNIIVCEWVAPGRVTKLRHIA